MTLETIEDVSPRSDDDVQDLAFARRGCCFCPPFSSVSGGGGRRGSVFWQRINPQPDGTNPTAPATAAGGDDPWWKNLKEWSEIVAGPKWKTFIRKFSNNRNTKKRGGLGKCYSQYDPLSYSLNFDDGQKGHFDEDVFSRGFSLRFSLPPSSAKSSMDFDKEGITLA